MKTPSWLRRPGIASAFTPNLGMAQECMTSAAVISIRIFVLHGRMSRLSTSRSRNGVSFVRSSAGSMYESPPSLSKSVYS